MLVERHEKAMLTNNLLYFANLRIKLFLWIFYSKYIIKYLMQNHLLMSYINCENKNIIYDYTSISLNCDL